MARRGVLPTPVTVTPADLALKISGDGTILQVVSMTDAAYAALPVKSLTTAYVTRPAQGA